MIPEALDADTALTMMLAEPLLIRRPLIEVEGRREVGFDPEMIDARLGLNKRPKGDMESCSKRHETKPCEQAVEKA